MTKTDEKILTFLQPYNNVGEFVSSDTYFCSIVKYNKEDYMYSVLNKVKYWVEKNGGRFVQLSNKRIIGDRKGLIVRIIFPCYGKRDMKNIMATLFYRK